MNFTTKTSLLFHRRSSELILSFRDRLERKQNRTDLRVLFFTTEELWSYLTVYIHNSFVFPKTTKSL